ncbi:MFS transporter [Pseudomonas putida]|jgi:hypothetical protein|uniref:MFS transporter n=1 Tax=Pseudomonas putida TaxID=303 RepID=UPI002363557D|nr:MFS transporter [Pseudomonas putida]MDD2055105.1 MFS transporter [Pseudomonas putida]
MAWQLTQVFWVGSLWLLHIVLLPVLKQIGLAPLLVEEVASLMGGVLVALAGVGVLLQIGLLVRAQGLASLWRDMRGQLLLMALYACGMYFLVRYGVPQALRWQLFSYLILAFSGLVLVLQPAPQKSSRARQACP